MPPHRTPNTRTDWLDTICRKVINFFIGKEIINGILLRRCCFINKIFCSIYALPTTVQNHRGTSHNGRPLIYLMVAPLSPCVNAEYTELRALACKSFHQNLANSILYSINCSVILCNKCRGHRPLID